MNPVSLNTSRALTPKQIPAFWGFGDVILTAEQSYAWLLHQKGLIGWTYSFNPECWAELAFDRLITGREVLKDKRIRWADNTHVKCYIAKSEMLIGSMNLTKPTIQDLCIFINSKPHIKFMREQFNKHWSALA